MKTVTLPQIEVDNTILLSLKNSADELAHNMKIYTAIMLYQKKKLSLGKAAQLIGIDRLEFIELLKKEDIPVFNYSNKEIDSIFDDANDLAEF